MRRHQRAHKDRKTCHECSISLPSLDKLRTHLAEAHGHQEFEHLCSECGYLAANANELEAHCRQHRRQDAVVYMCEMCSFSSMEKDRLMLHQSGHNLTGRAGLVV